MGSLLLALKRLQVAAEIADAKGLHALLIGRFVEPVKHRAPRRHLCRSARRTGRAKLQHRHDMSRVELASIVLA